MRLYTPDSLAHGSGYWMSHTTAQAYFWLKVAKLLQEFLFFDQGKGNHASQRLLVHLVQNWYGFFSREAFPQRITFSDFNKIK